MDAEELLDQLAADLGIAQLRFDANHACGLAFAGGLQIDVHHVPQDQVLHLAALLGGVRLSSRAELQRLLLEANQNPANLADGRFAIDAAQGGVVLCRTLLAHELKNVSLSAEVNRLMEVARTWRDDLAQRQLTIVDAI